MEPLSDSRIGSLFDPRAIVVTLHGTGDPNTLLPDELASTGSFSSARLSEYAAGRSCARAALRLLGLEPYALPTEADRRPRWPNGVVGSISHTANYCAVVLATTQTHAALGIDVERRDRIERELWPHLFIESERKRLDDATDHDANVLATLIFSAKESFYKCRYTFDTSWLDFTDVAIDLESFDPVAECGNLAARIVQPNKSTDFKILHGRYLVDPDVVWTGFGVTKSR